MFKFRKYVPQRSADVPKARHSPLANVLSVPQRSADADRRHLPKANVLSVPQRSADADRRHLPTANVLSVAQRSAPPVGRICVANVLKVKASGKKEAALKRLRSFLDAEEPLAVDWLLRVWDKQQAAITYREIREAILNGGMSEKQLREWQEDYAELVNTKLAPQWEKAMAAAAEAQKAEFPFSPYNIGVEAARDYVRQQGARLVTNLLAEQQDAIQAMAARAVYYEAETADSLSRLIRPVIGLTKRQSAANLNYYSAVKDSLLKAHPNMNRENAEKRAREAAAKYAGRQHRYRAMNIARTELAAAYNQGGYGVVKEAWEQGYIGDCKKTWLTADDERVCPICGGIDGEGVGMDALFSIGKLLPPAHPSCRCAVVYEEIGEPLITYDGGIGDERMPDVDMTENSYGSVADNSLTISCEQDKIDVGGERMDITGASGAIPRNDFTRMDAHAERYYEEIRNRKSDITAIAENTGFSDEDIKTIKQHIFYNEYALDGKGTKRFDPSYDMAISWQRLIEGKNIHEMDIIMLKHELLEHTLMTVNGTPYYKAHSIANEKYNYQKYCDELDRKAGLK